MSYRKHKFEGINFRLSGEGDQVVVFLHGFLGDLTIWNSFAGELKDNYTVLQVDLPGHGLSDTFGPVHSMPFMAEKIIALIDYLALTPVHLVG
ncbi:alpha/beta fold hydrolase, partial [Flavobacteriales bacterium]|nr:alpha/beta fold hydrolase [Flavobacteriales bacterium]